jgi:hypothetical protein
MKNSIEARISLLSYILQCLGVMIIPMLLVLGIGGIVLFLCMLMLVVPICFFVIFIASKSFSLTLDDTSVLW